MVTTIRQCQEVAKSEPLTRDSRVPNRRVCEAFLLCCGPHTIRIRPKNVHARSRNISSMPMGRGILIGLMTLISFQIEASSLMINIKDESAQGLCAFILLCPRKFCSQWFFCSWGFERSWSANSASIPSPTDLPRQSTFRRAVTSEAD